MARGIDLIARAVIVRDARLLVAHSVGAGNKFLPGGHIESGEFAADALRSWASRPRSVTSSRS